MSTRAQDFAAQFDAINADYLTVVAGCSDGQWQQTCPADGRTVALVAHHMATVQRSLAGMLKAAVSGDGMTLAISGDDVEQMNADHARDYAGIDRAETLEVLRTSGEDFVRLVRPLSDADLDRGVGVVAGYETTVGGLIEFAVVAHAAEHLAAIRGGIEG